MTSVTLLRTLVNCKSFICGPVLSSVTVQSPVRNPLFVGLFFNHEQVREMSRVKRRHTHPPYWHHMKNVQKKNDPLSSDNQRFIREIIEDKYSSASPVKGVETGKAEWTPKSRRSGVIARNIGIYPLWQKDGSRVLCTLLQVLDNHVIRYIPPAEYKSTLIGQKALKTKKELGCLVVGAEATRPDKFTRQYCSLFAESGLMPKKRLARFLVTPDAALPPCTPLTASHFVVGQAVDVYGKTIEHGFQGVVKRWGFKGGPASHGTTKFHRRGGTIGTGRNKARVWPGQKMPGHMGSERRVMRGLTVMRINSKYNVIYVKGSVPGATNSTVQLFDTFLPTRKFKKAPPFPTHFPPEAGSEQDDVSHPSLHTFGTPSIAH
uniref:Large ribosomal subunit protein uL3m n=1 Tax=Moina brachiata TaxID=675436 RepID=A0A4Y7NKD8_9CRUS|nr:EOG090X07HN [Moina brachiata]SVE93054.1 EOG090X07HN [Moina brachiata]